MTDLPADDRADTDHQTDDLQETKFKGVYTEKRNQKVLDSEDEEELVDADGHSKDTEEEGQTFKANVKTFFSFNHEDTADDDTDAERQYKPDIEVEAPAPQRPGIRVQSKKIDCRTDKDDFNR